MGDLDGAVEELRAALRQNPDAVVPRLTLASTLMAWREWEAARFDLEAVLRVHPDLGQAHYSIGVVRYARRDLNGAIARYRRASTAGPQNLDARYNIGLGLKLQRRDAEAIPELLAAAAGGHARAQYFVGTAYATGAGVERNLSLAVRWWFSAADQGVSQAHDALGQLRTVALGRGRRGAADRVAAEQAFRDYRADLWKRFPELTPTPDASVGEALLAQGRVADAVPIPGDGAGDAPFRAGAGAGAVLARVVPALARAGAAAIGIDVPLGQPGAPGRGGPTGDALLSQATALAGNVVFAIVPGEPVPALAQHARSVGHTLAPPDPDGVVRRIPVRAGVVDRSVPAWGLAPVAAAPEAAPDAIPVDRDGPALMTFAPLLPTLTFSAVSTAIDQGQRDRLQGLVDGKIVLLLLDPGSMERRTPVGLLSDGAIQAQVANAALTSSWRRDVPLTWTALAAVVVATPGARAFPQLPG